MTTLSLGSLQDKIRDPEFALARINATYQPGGGPGSRLFPPTFPTSRSDDSPYLMEERTCDGSSRRAVVLDQVPSQANRCEEALKTARQAGKIRLPLLRLTHDGAAKAVITGLDAPHRAFDAYWRDSLLDGEKFDRTPVGKALQATSLEDATALLQYDPATLVYGGWNSHRKGRQAKFPRFYSSEVVGWDPVVGTRKASRMDPLNLTGARNGDGDEWTYSPAPPRRPGCRQARGGGDGIGGPVLLHETDDSIGQHDQQDDDHVDRQATGPLEEPRRQRDCHGPEQQVDQRIGELLQETPPGGLPRLGAQLVGAVARQTRGGLHRGQPGPGINPGGAQRLVGGLEGG